ncbi:hypothetical protein Lal_00031697 [Lupinus albus]|nr:hypothetical protein Lal_00031697 [Lupinus albus]
MDYEILTVPVYYPAKPQPRERAWRNQRGKKTLLSLTLRGAAPIFGSKAASVGRFGRKTLSVRIRTVKAWPIDPLVLRNLKLEVSENRRESYRALDYDLNASKSESGLEAMRVVVARLPTRSRWPRPLEARAIGDPRGVYDPRGTP